MHKLHKEYLIEWASQYIDDVTFLEIKKDVIKISVGGKLVGIIPIKKFESMFSRTYVRWADSNMRE